MGELRSVVSLGVQPYVFFDAAKKYSTADELISHGDSIILPKNFPLTVQLRNHSACNPCPNGCANENCNCDPANCKITDSALLAGASALDGFGVGIQDASKYKKPVQSDTLRPLGFAQKSIDQMLKRNRFLVTSSISDLFPHANVTEDTTIGQSLTLVTTKRSDEHEVKAITDRILGIMNSGSNHFPGLGQLSAGEVARIGSISPYHSGALRSLQNHGLQ